MLCAGMVNALYVKPEAFLPKLGSDAQKCYSDITLCASFHRIHFRLKYSMQIRMWHKTIDWILFPPNTRSRLSVISWNSFEESDKAYIYHRLLLLAALIFNTSNERPSTITSCLPCFPFRNGLMISCYTLAMLPIV
jgi:hypothetical protein